MNGFDTWMRSDRHPRPRAYVVVFVCLALLALLTVIQVAHVHSINTDVDHCPLCVVLHTAAPVAAAGAVMILVLLAVLPPAVEVRCVHSMWQRQLFIRPPPSA